MIITPKTYCARYFLQNEKKEKKKCPLFSIKVTINAALKVASNYNLLSPLMQPQNVSGQKGETILVRRVVRDTSLCCFSNSDKIENDLL